VEEQYDQLATESPGVVGQKKTKIGFRFEAETLGVCYI
jgi:hypothetical protein